MVQGRVYDRGGEICPPRHQLMVGEEGFEPSTFWSQTKRASQAALLPGLFSFCFLEKQVSIAKIYEMSW